MANTNAPFGLRWLGFSGGSAAPTFGLIQRKIISSSTQPAARGDLMYQNTDGYVVAVTAAGTAASQCVGVFWGCEYLSNALGRRIVSQYWPGGDTSQDVQVLLVPLISTPPQLFYAQTTSTAITFADIGRNVDIGYAAPVSYGASAKSQLSIAASTLNTTVTLPFRVQGLYSSISAPGIPGTDDTSSYNWVIVSFNSDAETGTSA